MNNEQMQDVAPGYALVRQDSGGTVLGVGVYPYQEAALLDMHEALALEGLSTRVGQWTEAGDSVLWRGDGRTFTVLPATLWA